MPDGQRHTPVPPTRTISRKPAGPLAPPEKIQKVLARAGLGSRRELEGWIEQGRVRVDGRVARLGERVARGQELRVDGRVVHAPRTHTRRRVIAYHKPEGEVCTRSDPAGRPTVFARLPRAGRGRWIGIGRLDLNTSGLMLFTNDGELANALMHPSREIEREYAVRVLGPVGQEQLARLARGVALDGRPARFDTIRDAGGSGANHWYHVTLREGRRREVRRMWEAVGATVSRLIRVRYGPVELDRRLRQGQSRELEEAVVARLAEAAGLEPLPPPPRRRRTPPRRHGRH